MKTSIKEKKILIQELIGAEIQVIESTDPKLTSIQGQIIEETKNMLIISDTKSQKIKKIPKKNGIFQITLNNNFKYCVNGARLLNRPEERLRKIKKSR